MYLSVLCVEFTRGQGEGGVGAIGNEDGRGAGTDEHPGGEGGREGGRGELESQRGEKKMGERKISKCGRR